MQTSLTANSPTALEAVEGSAQVLPVDVDAMLASILPQNRPTADAQAQRKTPRFRVKWHVDILVDGRNIYHGFINDISTTGASVFLDCDIHPLKPTLRIHVPPLSVTCKPHFIEVSGNTVYMVYDGEKQLYRASISFNRFRVQSDQAFLEERLNKYHARIPEH